ncbi:phosphotransferase family protein [Halorientalis sp.]|uniref:phosphotransferase family protein n=1 Tax=Halorientalis sp. TaxID=1931229 RepID=UPI00260D7FC0|nr:phosphotransferase family protein [Halorientalis sp.]
MTETTGGASRYLDTEGVYSRVAERLGRAETWSLSHHDAGLGNETLFLGWGPRQFVLRRPPLSGTATASHDVGREYQVLSALDWTDLPTPRPVLACEDEAVAGATFTVQQRLSGDVLRHGEPVEYAAPSHRETVAEELVDTLAAIHAVDPTDVELADLGHSDLSARLEAWRGRFDRYRAETDREVPDADAVAGWLATNIPASVDRTLVHGDYTLANVTFSRSTPPELVGVLDWERAGAGDPLVDLGRLTAFWFEDETERAALPTAAVPGFTTREGFPARSALVDRYERETGRTFTNSQFYRALAVYEQAAVCEGYYLRHLRGESDRPAFAAMGDAVPALVGRARQIIEGAARGP